MANKVLMVHGIYCIIALYSVLAWGLHAKKCQLTTTYIDNTTLKKYTPTANILTIT